MQVTICTSEHSCEDQIKYCMESPEHKWGWSHLASKGVRLTNIQSVLAENLDSFKVSRNIWHEIQESTILLFCLFEQIKSQHKFMTSLHVLENPTAQKVLFLCLFKNLSYFNISKFTMHPSWVTLNVTFSWKSGHRSRLCAVLICSCITLYLLLTEHLSLGFNLLVFLFCCPHLSMSSLEKKRMMSSSSMQPRHLAHCLAQS